MQTYWFHPSRWENYALLALFSVLLMLGVAVHTVSQHHTRHLALAEAAEIVPAPRAREPQWVSRHQKIIDKAAVGGYDVMLLGDSITQGWEFHRNIWESAFPDIRALNAGISSDRVEHVLWRVEHGLFAKKRPKVVVLLAGINNLAGTEPQAIADGIGQTIRAIHARAPRTKVLVLGLFPAGKQAEDPKRARIFKANYAIATQARIDHAEYLDIGSAFLEGDGSLSERTSFDHLHLTKRGYEIWAKRLAPKLRRMLGHGTH